MTRNVKQANMDSYNDQISKKIETILAPTGYQTFKGVEVTLRERLSKKDVMDIQYYCLLKIAGTKMDMLKYFRRQITIVDQQLVELNKWLTKTDNDFPSTIAKFVNNKYRLFNRNILKRDELMRVKRELEDHRQYLLGVGPVIPDAVMKEHKL